MQTKRAKTNKLNILNIAWIGQGDFGDEAMAYALRRFFNTQGVDSITYYQLGKYPIHTDKNDLKIHSLYNFNTSNWKRKLFDNLLLRKFNAVIMGGGSMFHSYNSVNWKHEVVKKIRQVNKKPIFSACLGVSLRPFKSSLIEKICGDLLNDIDMAVLRDNYSADLAKKLSDNKRIYPSLDLTLLLLELCQEEMSDIINNTKREDDLVGVIFIKQKAKEEVFNNQNHLEKYITILNNILDKNKKVILFIFYLGKGYPDIELNQLLLKRVKYPEKVKIHQYNGDIFRTTKEMSRCGYIISMRLHGIIFSYMLRIPFISLGYNPKNDYFCQSVNYPLDMCFNIYSLARVDPVLRALDIMFKQGNKLYNQSLPVKEATGIVKSNLLKLIELMNKKI